MHFKHIIMHDKELNIILPVQMKGGNFSGMSLEVCEVEMVWQSLLFSRKPARDTKQLVYYCDKQHIIYRKNRVKEKIRTVF